MAHLEIVTALVTGGTRGIGLATAQRLACDGARVVVAGLVQARLDQAVTEIGHTVHGLRSDAAPMGRSATTDEVATAVAFLVGDRAAFITGQENQVDGGLTHVLAVPAPRQPAG